MAVHQDLPGISAFVSIDSDSAPEYSIPNDEVNHYDPEVIAHQEERTVTQFIECVEGQSFSINVSVKRPYRLNCDALSFELYVDGEWIDTEIMCKSDYKDSDRDWRTEIKGLKVQSEWGNVVKPFTFAKIKLAKEQVNDSMVRAQKKKLSSVGEIELHVDRRKIIDGRQIRKDKYRDMDDLGVDYSKRFHPKPLVPSGKTHGSILGEAEPMEDEIDYIHTKTIDGDDFPLVIFKFKYRSKKALQSLLVIPQSPSSVHRAEGRAANIKKHLGLFGPVPPQAEARVLGTPKSISPILPFDLNGLDSDEVTRLKQLVKSMKDKSLPDVKAEDSKIAKSTKAEPPSPAQIKREAIDHAASGRRAKKPKNMAGKVTIDLTGTDSEEERAKRVVVELD